MDKGKTFNIIFLYILQRELYVIKLHTGILNRDIPQLPFFFLESNNRFTYEMMQCLICLFNSLSTNVTRQSLKQCVQFESRFVHDHASGGSDLSVTSNAKSRQCVVATSKNICARAFRSFTIKPSRNLNNTPKRSLLVFSKR